MPYFGRIMPSQVGYCTIDTGAEDEIDKTGRSCGAYRCVRVPRACRHDCAVGMGEDVYNHVLGVLRQRDADRLPRAREAVVTSYYLDGTCQNGLAVIIR